MAMLLISDRLVICHLPLCSMCFIKVLVKHTHTIRCFHDFKSYCLEKNKIPSFEHYLQIILEL